MVEFLELNRLRKEYFMMRRSWLFLLSASLVLALYGCGGVRYSHVAPEGKDYHPKRVALLPADVGPYEEARDVIDHVVAGVLVKQGWFTDVIAGETMKRLLAANDALRQTVMDYKTKLKTVNFSDPELSRKIGETARADAFVIIYVDYWGYTRENKEKVAKVGLVFKMVDAPTGNIVWKAGHQEAEDYLMIKPSLAGVAEEVVEDIVEEMPH
jgi:hypothetical protein